MFNKQNRILYIKPGNVSEELKKISENEIIYSGPLSFTSSFYIAFKKYTTRIISFRSKKDKYRYNNCEAITYKTSKNKIIKRIKILIFIINNLINFRPKFVLVVNRGFELWITYIYCQLTNSKIIHSIHGRLKYHNQSILKTLFYNLDKQITRNIKYIICHDHFIKQELLSLGVKKKCITVFNSDYRQFYDKYRSLEIESISDNKIIIIYSGLIIEEKGIFDLLKAFHIISNKKHVYLKYFGRGSDQNKLINMINNYSMDNIEYFGYVNHNKLIKHIINAYVVVTPTRLEIGEGRCMSAEEALILGTPVIAPNFAPFNYFIKNNKNGLLFKPNSYKNLGENLNKVLNDQKLYDKIKKGAQITGKDMITPERSFYQALVKTITPLL